MGTQIVSRTTVRNLGPVQDHPVHAGETEAQALHRLAAQAKVRGVRIIQNIVTNAHFATSASRPGTLHKVTLYSCDCAGFLRHARCMHYALVLEAYHSLPPIVADSGPDGGGAALTVTTAATAAVGTDVVLSIVPVRRPAAVEGARIAHAGTRPDGSTYRILHADAVVVDGVRHRVGDAVMVTDRRWGWVPARITCIRTVGSTGRVWKVDVDGTGYGETTRALAEVRAVAVSSEAVRHAA